MPVDSMPNGIMPNGITAPASIKKALNRLVQLKVIYRHEGEYKFVNPFFKSWLIWKNY